MPVDPRETPKMNLRERSRGHHGFQLDAGITFLNHGSFGAVPRAVRLSAEEWRSKLEARPIEMLGRRMTGLLDLVRERVAGFVGTNLARVGFVTNATSGVGAVLRSIDWKPGDRIVLSNQGYNAVRQAAQYCCERFGCELVIVDLPLPMEGDDVICDRFAAALGGRTRLVIVDHITSPTALILPVAQIAAACRARGVRCLVDGAHAPGMLPLEVDAIGADWYTGNLHKWVCAPKGAAFLVASEETVSWTHPETTSHFHGEGFVKEFDWQGTRDFANWLAIPTAIDFIRGEDAPNLNHQLAVWAHQQLCADFGAKPISPLDGSRIGSMAAIALPPNIARAFPSASEFQRVLYEQNKIEVPIIDWGGGWYVRVSAQIYNQPEDYLKLSRAVLSAGGGDAGTGV